MGSGGIMALKMQSSRLEVKGHANVGVLRVSKKYRLSGGVRSLRLMNGAKPGGFAVGRLAAQSLAFWQGACRHISGQDARICQGTARRHVYRGGKVATRTSTGGERKSCAEEELAAALIS